MSYGIDEIKAHPDAAKFHDWLEQQEINHVWSTPAGDHEWDTWRTELLSILPRVFPAETADQKAVSRDR